jgi:hypothetical protein
VAGTADRFGMGAPVVRDTGSVLPGDWVGAPRRRRDGTVPAVVAARPLLHSWLTQARRGEARWDAGPTVLLSVLGSRAVEPSRTARLVRGYVSDVGRVGRHRKVEP